MNANYKTLSGNDVAEQGVVSDRYKEYREKWHNNPDKFIVEDFPLFLDIEATSACNLNCTFCVQTRANFKRGFMPVSLYRRIIEEAASEGCYGCKFHTIGRGEPLIHKQIVEMVKIAKKAGLIDVYLNTNGQYMHTKMIKGLLDVGLDRISISVEGFTQYFYELRRKGGSWNNLIRNVTDLRLQRDRKNYRTKIRVQTVKVKGLDLKEYSKFWKQYADEVGVVDFKDMKNRKEGVVDKGFRCPQLWQRMSVLYTGDILPCNHDDRLFAVIGNRRSDFIKSVWHSDSMNYLREVHKSGMSHKISACDGCSLRTSEILRNGKK